MPIVELQRVSGSFTGNSGSVDSDPLGAAATAGNLLVVALGDNHGSVGTPSGFTKATPATAAYVFYKVAAGGETTVTFTNTGASSQLHSYDIFELEGADQSFPVDVACASAGNVNTNNSGTMPRSTTYDGWAIGVWSMIWSAGTVVPTASAHTNGFEELDDHGLSGATNAVGMTVAARPVQSLDNFASTITVTGTVTQTNSVMVVFTAADARREPNIPYFWGFSEELAGFPACHSVSPANHRYWETQTGSPTIDADGLRLASTAAAEQIGGPTVPVLTGTSPKAALQRLRLRFNTSLPGADLELAKITSGADAVTLRYRTASQKLGLQLNSGTEQLSDATVTADSWVDADIRVVGTTTAWVADWRVNYGSGWVDQTQVTVTAAAAVTNWTPMLGWSAASTGDVSIAYAAYSVTPGHYPLGDYTVVFLGPDIADTPTVLGTASNFRRFTANGTIDGAYDGPAIMNALDDWPPTFGASADGLAVVTADASGIRIPMATYDAAGNGGSVRAARPVLPIWAASATTATIAVRGYDGSVTTTLYFEADPSADTSSTPPWFAKMWRPTNGWDQAKLDAAAVLVLSSDATPDIGPHAVGMEVLVQVAYQVPLAGDAVTALGDPVSEGILGLDTTAPAGQGMDVTYEVDGTPTSFRVEGGASHTETIDAPDMPTVNRVEVAFDPEP